MNLQLDGCQAFVSGASSGIGSAAARLLAAEGAHVVVGYNTNRAGAEHTAAAVRASGRRAELLQIDQSNPQSVQAGVTALKAAVPGLDVLVVAGGTNSVTPLTDVTPAEWERVVAVNLNGPFYLVQAALPLLRNGCAVVLVSSVAAHTGAPHHAHYAAAKAGLVNLTKSLARGLAPGVRVNCVAPGITLTPMGADTLANLPDDYAERKLLSRRYAEPEEIARWIVFLASPLNGFVHGITMDVNGGRVMR